MFPHNFSMIIKQSVSQQFHFSVLTDKNNNDDDNDGDDDDDDDDDNNNIINIHHYMHNLRKYKQC